MTHNKSVEETPEVAELACDLAREFDLSRHGENLIYNRVIILLEKYRQTSQEREREIVETVLPYLKSFLNTLDSDWSVNPVQATTLEYRIPESVLRDRANEIEAKRERAKQLRQLIENFTNPNKD